MTFTQFVTNKWTIGITTALVLGVVTYRVLLANMKTRFLAAVEAEAKKRATNDPENSTILIDWWSKNKEIVWSNLRKNGGKLVTDTTAPYPINPANEWETKIVSIYTGTKMI